MNNCKYIVIKSRLNDNTYKQELMIMFPKVLNHDDTAALFRGFSVISAGFVDLISQKCYGRSESLNLDSRPNEDSQLLENLL